MDSHLCVGLLEKVHRGTMFIEEHGQFVYIKNKCFGIVMFY